MGLRYLLKRKQTFVVYGNGEIAHLFLELLEKYRCKNLIQAFVVSKKTNENQYNGIPIISIQEFVDRGCMVPIVIGVENPNVRDEIINILESVNLTNYITLSSRIIRKCYFLKEKIRNEKLKKIFRNKDRFFYKCIYSLHKNLYIKFLCKKEIIFKLYGNYKISLRLFSRDFDFFENIFVGVWNKDRNIYEGEYDFDLSDCDIVFDFGSNIGLFTLKFAKENSEKKFVVVEPELNNYKLLLKNTKNFDNVVCMKKGVWYRDAFCKVYPARTIIYPSNTPSEGGFYIGECDSVDKDAVQAFSISTFVQLVGAKKYVIKMDIEGAEEQIFLEGNLEWLHSCEMLIIETHVRYAMNKDLDDRICKIMFSHGFTMFQLGENKIFKKEII